MRQIILPGNLKGEEQASSESEVEQPEKTGKEEKEGKQESKEYAVASYIKEGSAIEFPNIAMGRYGISFSEEKNLIIGTTGVATCLAILIHYKNYSSTGGNNLLAITHFDPAASSSGARFANEAEIEGDTLFLLETIIRKMEDSIKKAGGKSLEFNIEIGYIFGCEKSEIISKFIRQLKNFNNEPDFALKTKIESEKIIDFIRKVKIMVINLCPPTTENSIIANSFDIVARIENGIKLIDLQYNTNVNELFLGATAVNKMPEELKLPLLSYSINLTSGSIKGEAFLENIPEFFANNELMEREKRPAYLAIKNYCADILSAYKGLTGFKEHLSTLPSDIDIIDKVLQQSLIEKNIGAFGSITGQKESTPKEEQGPPITPLLVESTNIVPGSQSSESEPPPKKARTQEKEGPKP